MKVEEWAPPFIFSAQDTLGLSTPTATKLREIFNFYPFIITEREEKLKVF